MSQRLLIEPQLALIYYLIECAGGAPTVAIRANCAVSILNNAKKTGYVPVKWVRNVSEALGVTPYALNYIGLHNIVGGEPPTWMAVVESCKLPAVLESMVMKAGNIEPVLYDPADM